MWKHGNCDKTSMKYSNTMEKISTWSSLDTMYAVLAAGTVNVSYTPGTEVHCSR